MNIIILLTFHNQMKQHSLANVKNNHISQMFIDTQIQEKKINNTKIKIQSNQATFHLSNATSHFSGNVIISYNQNTLYADEIYLYKTINNNIILSGTGNIFYHNNIINMTGKKIINNIQTKDTDLYQGNFFFIQQKTYGSANHIKQRNNNRYTILQNANFTTCSPHNKYWHILGSQTLYDHKKENLDIWNAYFKIKKTPILYIPYIQLFLSHKEHSKHQPNIPEYNNKQGVEIKLPYYFNIHNHFHGNITTKLIPKKGIQFQNHIQYFNKLNEGSINFNLLNNKELNKNYWLLYYYNNNCLRKKWYINNQYTKISNHNYFYNTRSKYTYKTNNYYIKKNISWEYTDTTWNINLFYKEFQPLSNDLQNIYNIKPQLNINFYKNKFNYCKCHLFSQITQFINNNHNYPKTTRLHIEPSINILSNILYANINTEIKLKNTYYQQKNIDFYNKNIHINKNIYLKRSVNRYLPQFTSTAKLILYKKNNIRNKYKQILEPQIQYLYVPYYNQNNIGLYDTTIFETTNHSDIFQDTLYSGLDRIAAANQLASNICTKIYNKNNTELFRTSLGQIYFLTPQKIENNIIKKHNIHKNNITWASSTYWKINQSLGIATNLQYNTQINKLKSGNTIIEHRTNDNKIIQINFRYLNTEYFSKIEPAPIDPIYQKNITQFGIIGNYPINTYWTFSSSQFYNIKDKHIINQSIGIQYRTCCWKINAGYERKANILHPLNNIKKYNNKLLVNLTLSGINHNAETSSKICNILYTNILPYQSIL